MAGYSNVRKFRRRPTLNVGVCIFAVIFIYMLISVIIYAASKKTIIYEVVDGSLASEDTYQGFIVRDETVIKSDYSGSVNYFLKSGHKAGLETVICSVDETGRVYDRINEEADKTLSKEALAQIRAKLSSLTSGYNNDTFYDCSSDIPGSNAVNIQRIVRYDTNGCSCFKDYINKFYICRNMYYMQFILSGTWK